MWHTACKEQDIELSYFAYETLSAGDVDDHRVVRQGVRAFLATQPDLLVVGDAESGALAVDLAARYVPDVALMDLVMPGMDGVEATRQLKRVSPRTQIIVLTSYHDDEHIFPVLRAGALSYLLKDSGVDALAEAVRGAARGQVALHPRMAARVIRDLQGAPRDKLNPAQRKDREGSCQQYVEQAPAGRSHAGGYLCPAWRDRAQRLSRFLLSYQSNAF